MRRITIVAEIDDTFFADILCTAIESPFGDWFLFGNIRSKGDDYESAVVTERDSGGGAEGDEKLIGYDQLAEGIRIALAMPEGRLASDLRKDIYFAVSENDAGQIDAIAADAIVQFVMFGELRYS